MKKVQIKEKKKIGKKVFKMIKELAINDIPITFLDETDYLLSSEANKEVMMNGIDEVKKGEKGKAIKPSELWE